jgi:Rieske 2Fe-2S family protein
LTGTYSREHPVLERTLPRAAYFSDDQFARERERIFAREWVCVGRADEVPETGDTLVVTVADESVLIVRDGDGRVRAFYNVCRHRGCQLVLAEGTAHAGTAIRCPYHAWTYAFDGTLRSAPFLEDGDGFTRADFPLHAVAAESWGGFLFVSLAPERSLAEQLGAAPARLANYPLDTLRLAQRLRYEVAANWKVVLENYNECYHCAGVHPELCRIVPAFKYRGGSELDWDRGIPHADGAWTFTRSGTSARAPFPSLNDDERTRHKGELIYPNLMVSLSADHVAAFTLWPRSPTATTIVCDFLFSPEEMARPTFDPSDAVEFWDVVNRQDWTICEGVQRGMRSRKFESGFYAPMESWSLDIRRYIAERL